MTNDLSTEFGQETTIYKPSAAIDPERLDYLWGLTGRIAASTAVPRSLAYGREDGATKDSKLPIEDIRANLFMVFEQADRWKISPFALMSCAAIIHGRLGFEGKVIMAVLESCFGIALSYSWSGEGDDRTIVISGRKPGTEDILTVEGKVKTWKTTGTNTPWRPDTYDKMLAYRGAREWARLYQPSAILGIHADDEIMQIAMEERAQAATHVGGLSVMDRLKGNTGGDGFNAENVRAIEQKRSLPIDTTVKDDAKKAMAEATGPDSEISKRAADAGNQNSSTSTVSEGKQVDDETGGDGSQSRLPRSKFEEYADTLKRLNTKESLTKGHEKFWEKDGKPSHPLDIALARKIQEANHQRAAGADAAKVAADVEAAIANDFDSGRL